MSHKTSLKVAAVAVGLMLAQPIYAQTVKTLSLQEAIELSLKNSKQLKLSAAKVDEAVAHTRDAWNNHLPDLKVSGSYLRLSNPDVALKIKLPTSSSSSSGTGGEATAGQNISVEQAAYGMATASVPLFSGMRIKYGVESAKYLEQAAKLDAEHDREEIIQNTVNAYGNLYKASIAVDIVKENLSAQKQRVADFANLERNGLIARNDLLKAQLQQSNIELTVLDAENNLKLASVNMDLMLGLDGNTELRPDSSAYQKIADAGTILQWEQSAMHNRKDVAALSYREKAAISGIRATKGEYYPSIGLSGGLFAVDVPNLLTVTNAFNAGLGVSYNFGALWKTGAKVDLARAQLHQVQAKQDIAADQIRVQVNQAYQNYLVSTKRIDVYAKAIEQAEENYRITKNKFDNNLSTTTELLDADTARLQARLNYAASKADAVTAYKKLQQTAGVLSK